MSFFVCCEATNTDEYFHNCNASLDPTLNLRPSCSIEGFLQKCCLDRRDPKFETIAKALFHPNKHRFYDGNKIGRFRRMLNEC
jgi:hypothetical protein